MMSISDAIYHICFCFREDAKEFIIALLPSIINYFDTIDENKNNSIFSIIGMLTFNDFK
jgi:hypothetical protein